MPFAREHPTGTQLTLKVVPGASRDRIAGTLGDALKVQVAAPPEKGAANAAVRRLLAEALGVPLTQLTLVRGETQPRKTLIVVGLAPDEIRRRIQAAGG